jgi:hypothetical protein
MVDDLILCSIIRKLYYSTEMAVSTVISHSYEEVVHGITGCN